MKTKLPRNRSGAVKYETLARRHYSPEVKKQLHCWAGWRLELKRLKLQEEYRRKRLANARKARKNRVDNRQNDFLAGK